MIAIASYSQYFIGKFISKIRQEKEIKDKCTENQKLKCHYLKMRFFYIKNFKESTEYNNALERLANKFNKESFPHKRSIFKSHLHFYILAVVKLKMQ